MNCPLCTQAGPFVRVVGGDGRRWHRCGRCALVFVDRADLPAPADERAFYLTHENRADDPGYRRFLSRLVDPVLPLLPARARTLDYGCGPAPTLSMLVRAAGHACDDFDPLFHPDTPSGAYDAIFCSECVEHFHRPGEEFTRLHALLAPGGLLAVMTEQWSETTDFTRWRYARDPTHVALFHANTFDWLAQHLGYTVLARPEPRVVILRRNA